jgi:hypothetical protein
MVCGGALHLRDLFPRSKRLGRVARGKINVPDLPAGNPSKPFASREQVAQMQGAAARGKTDGSLSVLYGTEFDEKVLFADRVVNGYLANGLEGLPAGRSMSQISCPTWSDAEPSDHRMTLEFDLRSCGGGVGCTMLRIPFDGNGWMAVVECP